MNTGSGSSTNAKILQLAICLDYLRFNCVKSSEGVALSYQIGQCDVTEETNIRWPPLSDMILRFWRFFCVRRETCSAWKVIHRWECVAEKCFMAHWGPLAFREVYAIFSSPFPSLSVLHNPQTNMKPCHVASPFLLDTCSKISGKSDFIYIKTRQLVDPP